MTLKTQFAKMKTLVVLSAMVCALAIVTVTVLPASEMAVIAPPVGCAAIAPKYRPPSVPELVTIGPFTAEFCVIGTAAPGLSTAGPITVFRVLGDHSGDW